MGLVGALLEEHALSTEQVARPERTVSQVTGFPLIHSWEEWTTRSGHTALRETTMCREIECITTDWVDEKLHLKLVS